MKNNNKPKRIITAASLFDGHDAAINMVRRLLQELGCEVIHLGHDRSVEEIVMSAIQEDPHAVAISSYQGGHMEYFQYLSKRLKEENLEHVKIFGGGGGVILPKEADELEKNGVTKIFRPEDGASKGLIGMIQEVIDLCDINPEDLTIPNTNNHLSLSRKLTYVENNKKINFKKSKKNPKIIGITGTGGSGKSSLIDELILRFSRGESDKKIAILAADPTRARTGGALLGDRIRMNAIYGGNVFFRSLATRSRMALSSIIGKAIDAVKSEDFDLIFVETAGIGQADNPLEDIVDVSIYVMTSEYGAPSQLEKIEMLDTADLIVLNKYDHRAGEDALRDIQKQVRRLKNQGHGDLDDQPVFATIASQFADPGVNELYETIKTLVGLPSEKENQKNKTIRPTKHVLIPGNRERYLAEISETVHNYKKNVTKLEDIAEQLQAISLILKKDKINIPKNYTQFPSPKKKSLEMDFNKSLEKLGDIGLNALRMYDDLRKYNEPKMTYSIRGKDISVKTYSESLAGTKISKVSIPKYRSWADRIKWILLENTPGKFPFTQGVFDFRRSGEDPTRMFAGEGPPEQTNKRFHLLAESEPYNRLSTAFDSVTLYGRSPESRPDIYGKVGESGVSIATVEDMGRLYKGFDLCDPATSVSMTINGPAPTILAFFLNTALNQQVEKFKKTNSRIPNQEELKKIKELTFSSVRGTVQADIFKEDQAQNTCIFSTEFSLKLMGDMQEWFVNNKVKNFYSVSISGYHIAEAGANPITQLALTLSNGFTYIEYYLSRGMSIDDFAKNLSFFFSCGLDPEYQVLGRVARRIWAIALREKYGSNIRSQKLKYHIQTSGRSLHAQEIQFNDIRTTLQALMAYYDRCDSLHTNAYDEAICTPTEESVRRALAIQQIITKELGTAKCENILQGSFFIEELTELVENAVLKEFESINRRGGVLGAMELGYQRSKIQEESLHYEHLKHSGELPVVGVNTFIGENTEPVIPQEITRSRDEDRDNCVKRVEEFENKNIKKSSEMLKKLQKVALDGGNIFEQLMETSNHASLGQITDALFKVGGKYRRNL
mgnify:CR=1 FL=1